MTVFQVEFCIIHLDNILMLSYKQQMIQRTSLDIIERFFKDLARTMALLMGKSLEEKMEFYEKAYDEWLGLSMSEIEELSPEELIGILINEKQLNLPQLELLASVMNNEAETFQESGKLSKSKDRIQKALIIFDHVNANSEVFSFERQGKINNLNSLLKKIE